MSNPVKVFKEGLLQVAIWENQSKEGDKFYTVTPSRSYKENPEDDNSWEQTSQLNRNNLPAMAALLNCAYNWMQNN